MVLQYWQSRARTGSVPSFSEIASALHSPESKGVLGSQIKRYLTSLDYRVFIFKGQWGDIKNHVSKGRPLIVALGNPHDLDHYVVVAGWDSDEHVVLVNDPARRKLLKLDQVRFMSSWSQTSCWTLLALPASTATNLPSPDTSRDSSNPGDPALP